MIRSNELDAGSMLINIEQLGVFISEAIDRKMAQSNHQYAATGLAQPHASMPRSEGDPSL